jgi:hypothetical protein
MSSPANDSSTQELRDFSLVGGGPLFQLWRRTGLAGDDLQLTRRRMLFMALLAWVPLLLLSIAEGHAWGNSVALTFLRDIETHVRLLIAVPLLIVGEVTVHKRLLEILRLFPERGLIRDAGRPQFRAALSSAMRLRNSVAAELLLIAFVYGIGVLLVWRTQGTLDMTSWYAVPNNGELALSGAGWWAGCVSMPIFQFLLLRWYFRIFIWARLLWQVSRIDLNLRPTHPDGKAGLHFLSTINRAYTPVLLAQGTVLAGMIANRIFYAGANLKSFSVELVGTAALIVFAILGPLLAFTPKLRAARHKGMEEYGTLGQRYAREFDNKWFQGGAAAGEPLVGSADIQSLADLHSSYLAVRDIGWAPFGLKNVLQLTVVTLLPVTPLLLTTFSPEQLLERVLKVFF